LGTPFIRSLFPLQINNEGIITQHLGQPIIFRFIKKPIIRDLNPIHYKQNQINFLKEEISFKNIDHQVQQPQTKERIQPYLNKFNLLFVLIFLMPFGKENNTLLTFLMKRIFKKNLYRLKPDLFK